MKTLIIVESPTKAKTIERILGKDYVVKPSMGHIRDLPKSTLGVDAENNFAPHYITIRGKGDTIKVLRDEAKKADRVLLGSDPDREGEAIAWHLREYLGLDNDRCRITFNEITDSAVKTAAASPQEIDIKKVEAQQARRILDRLVGYGISPLLWKKVKKGLSAGRVQSVALRLICDREEEIKNFVAEEYWNIYARLRVGDKELTLKLVRVNNKKAVLANREAVDEILAGLADAKYTVDSVTVKEKKKNPVPPFTTSAMQQEASRRLSMMAKKTMQIAQQLYEGIAVGGKNIGLISYMRTDSVRINEEAQNQAREFILGKYGRAFVPEKPNQYRSGKGLVQDAHEAIRPTSVERTPAALKPYLTPQQYKLYKLIWERFVASQMTPAIIDLTTVEVKAGNCLFRATGRIIRFNGYLQVYNDGKTESADSCCDKEEGERVDISEISMVKQGETLPLAQLDTKQNFTQPPPSFNEAMLIKTMEELGIGRPSTYAPTIDTILSRCYVVREEKQLFPTELGILVIDLMKNYFADIIDVEFTASMENKLDQVEEGKAEWTQVVETFYRPFEQTLKAAEEEIEKIVIEPEKSDEVCEKCGLPMVYRMGRYGRFLACSGFPECRNTKAIVNVTPVTCLACGGQIVQHKSRTGRIFYGCGNYPQCRYISWDLPIEEKCPDCGTQLSERNQRGGGKQIICPNKDCPSRSGEAKKPKGRPAKNKK
ncbi:MAG: type I DNA topoisomerase [Clostridia bacterium]|nr:type I DNA topoisomerase [Clostridia bacterium]